MIVTGPPVVLVTVAVSVAVLPTWRVPKSSAAGLKASCCAVPTPVRLTTCGEPAAVSVKVRVPVAGPVAAGDFAQSEDLAAREFTEAQFLAVLGANTHVYPRVTSDIDHGRAVVRGTLWGTNLAMISHLVGTPFMPAIDDGILLIEDIGEAPYRVERMLHQLRLAGILERQRAIVLGGFTDCDSAPGARFPYTMPEVVETLRQLVSCPVLTGFPFGHITAKVTLPMGAAAELTIDGADYTLAVRDYWRD